MKKTRAGDMLHSHDRTPSRPASADLASGGPFTWVAAVILRWSLDPPDNPKEDGGLIHPARGGFTLRLLLILFFLTPAVSSHASERRIGEVFLVSQKKGLTELVLRTSTELIPGLVVQVGKKEFAVVGPKQRQDDTGFYYEASIPEVSLIKQGDPVFWVPIGEFEAPPGKGGPEVLIEIRETIPFTPKRVGRITATQPPKVLVDWIRAPFMMFSEETYSPYTIPQVGIKARLR